MSKIIFNIKSLVLNIGAAVAGEVKRHPLEAILADVINGTGAKAKTTKVLSSDAIIDVLKANGGTMYASDVADVLGNVPEEVVDAALAAMAKFGIVASFPQEGGRTMYAATLTTADAPETAEDATETDGATGSEDAPGMTMDGITAFLHSDSRYKLRTLSAIAKHFGAGTNSVEGTLDSMLAMDLVGTKRNRTTGDTLYYSLVDAPTLTTASDTPTAPALTGANVRSFIQSNPQFTSRSRDAIAKHFGVAPNYPDLIEVLDEMVDADDLSRTTRRSDSMPLYSVA